MTSHFWGLSDFGNVLFGNRGFVKIKVFMVGRSPFRLGPRIKVVGTAVQGSIRREPMSESSASSPILLS